MFYLTTHSTHFIYCYMASDIWLGTILIVRKETCCHHIGYSLRLTARVLLYAPSHRQDSTYHSLCYTSRGALAGTRNSSMGSPHEGSIRRPIAPWANALTTELPLAPRLSETLPLYMGTLVRWEEAGLHAQQGEATEKTGESDVGCCKLSTEQKDFYDTIFSMFWNRKEGRKCFI